jgi:hypothetical protein
MVTYAYLSGGRRKLLIHVNDVHVTDFDHEISILRAAWAELRGPNPHRALPPHDPRQPHGHQVRPAGRRMKDTLSRTH